MKRIIFLILVLLMILPSLLFARGSQAPENYIRFAWWGNTLRDERTMRLIDLFVERNPGVVIEPEPSSWDGYWQRMSTMAAAGNLPDIMQHSVTYIRQYAERNQVVDLYEFSRRGLIDLTHWPEAGISSGVLDGRLYGLNVGTNAFGMAIDPAVLAQAGITIDDTTWTWADYERIALQVFQRTGIQTVNHSHPHMIEGITRQYGSGLFSEDGRSLAITNIPAARNAYRALFEMELRLRQAGALYDPESAMLPGLAIEESPIARGRTWNAFIWSNTYVAYQNASRRPLSYVMYPSVEGPRPPFALQFHASQFLSMTANAENRDLAARFIDFFLNDIDANRILLAERGVPVPTNVRQDLHAMVDETNRYVFDYITRITPFVSPTDPPAPGPAGEVSDTMHRFILQILTGGLAPAAGLDQMIQASNAILSR